MITFDRVGYRYKNKVEALSDISCTIGPGLHLMAGENGAGKTTFLHLCAGLLYPTSGTCDFKGVELRRREPEVLSRVQYFSSQSAYFFPAGDIRAMVKSHACFFPGFDGDMLQRNLSVFGIDEGQTFRSMSAGTFSKAALAYMFSLGCDVLLLDEPTVWLDPVSRHQFRQMMVECVGPEQAVIVSTHDFAEAEALYDSLMIIHRGKLLLDSPVAEIAARLGFVTGPSRRQDALYSEMGVGGIRSIVPVTEDENDTQPDFMLLYSALISDCSASILKHLKSDVL